MPKKGAKKLRNEVTGEAAASAAGKLLGNPKTRKIVKKVAASDLTQRVKPPAKKAAPKKHK